MKARMRFWLSEMLLIFAVMLAGASGTEGAPVYLFVVLVLMLVRLWVLPKPAECPSGSRFKVYT